MSLHQNVALHHPLAPGGSQGLTAKSSTTLTSLLWAFSFQFMHYQRIGLIPSKYVKLWKKYPIMRLMITRLTFRVFNNSPSDLINSPWKYIPLKGSGSVLLLVLILMAYDDESLACVWDVWVTIPGSVYNKCLTTPVAPSSNRHLNPHTVFIVA